MKRMIRLEVLAAVAWFTSSCMAMTTEINSKEAVAAKVPQSLNITSSVSAMMQVGGPKSLINETQFEAEATRMGTGVTCLGAEERDGAHEQGVGQADEKGAVQLRAQGKQPESKDVRIRLVRLQDNVPYFRLEIEFAPSETADQRMQPSCQKWNTKEFFRNATSTDVKYCLVMGMNVSARDYASSPTPLHLAAQFGNPGSITALIDAGANIEATADYGESGGPYSSHIDFTALHAASLWGSPANMKALIDAGANIHADLLDWVAARGSPSNLKVLIDAGADVTTGLFAAVYGGPVNIAILVEAGAIIDVRNENGRTPLHVAADIEFWEPDIAGASIKALVDRGADVEARDQRGRTPLHFAAAESGGPAIIEALLEAGADIEARDQDGWTPLHVAAGVEYGEWASNNITTLIDAGASLEVRDYGGRTPLQVAAGMGGLPVHPGNVAILLEAGADSGARDNDGLSQYKPAPASRAQDYTRWNLPEGALARLGKGAISDGDRAVAYSPDGTRLAVATSLGVWLYDAHTGAEVALLQGHTDRVNSVSFSPDGATLASGSEDNTVRLWDAAGGQVKSILKIEPSFRSNINAVTTMSFSPDGSTLASGDGWKDGAAGSWEEACTVRLWDVASGQEKATLQGHRGGVTSMSFSPDGATLASSCEANNAVQLWDVAGGRVKATLQGHARPVESLSFSPDGATLASGSNDGKILLWDVSGGQKKATLQGQTGPVESLSFSPDRATLASGGNDGTILLWDISSSQAKATLRGHTGPVGSVSFSPDSQTLASASGGWDGDNTVRLWDATGDQEKAAFEGHTGSIASVSFSPDGVTLASGSEDDNTVRLWDVASGQETAALAGHTSDITSVTFSPDGATLASGSLYKTIRLWDVANGEANAVLEGHMDSVSSVSFSPDGSTLASGVNRGWANGTIRLWDVATGRETAMLEGHTDWVGSVSFSSDGTTIASGSEDNTVRLWDVSSGQLKSTLQGHMRKVYSVAFSPVGATLASGSEDNTVRLWDVSSGQLKATLQGHTREVNSVAFSPDGRILASGSNDATIRLWDVSSGQEKATVQGHEGWGHSAVSTSFSPDGRFLASGSRDGTILLWDMSPYITPGNGAQTAESVDEDAQIALQTHEYSLWAGEWIRIDSNIEDNYYSILRIQDVGDHSFTYSSECRNIPYGPNAVWSDEERASFRGPFRAVNPVTGASFSLRVSPNDRHDRVMEMNPVQCSHSDGSENVFVFNRPVYRAGFDCDQAATSVETTICHNELLAQGDLEMSGLYRELLEKFPTIEVETLRSAQRIWLQKRNRDCLTGNTVDEVCLARLYSDRLAALAKLKDSLLGAEPRFDAAYALALVIRGTDLRQDTATRLAMYPLGMDPEGTFAWRADDSGLLFEQSYTGVAPTHYVSIGEVEFRYSDMLYVGMDGTVWTAAHTEPVMSLEHFNEHEPWRVWMGAGRDPLTIRSETGIELTDAPTTSANLPNLVRSWLNRHPVSRPVEQ